MTTSGTVTWNLNIANIVETAARRARGSKEGSLSAQDAINARNCLNMVLTDITNAGHPLSKLEYKTVNLVQGTRTYTLPDDVLDIFDVVYAKYNGSGSDPEYNETALTRIDLAAYNRINNKDIQAYLSQFALYRGLTDVTMYLYPTPESSSDQLRYWALTRIEDASAAYQDVDLAYRYTNTLIAGVAYYLALELPVEAEQMEAMEMKISRLAKNYSDALDVAFGEDRDRSSFFAYPSFRRY